MPVWKKLGYTAAAVCGSALVGYCIYFDKLRRNDPEFKKKLHQRRQEKKKQNESAKINVTFPDSSDIQALQKFFMDEIELGETLLRQGNVEEGVMHLACAVVVCSQPQHLLQSISQTLSDNVFKLLLERIPLAKNEMKKQYLDDIQQLINNDFEDEE